MIILGIGDSHEAHACVVKDGVLLAAMGEERLSRLKADMGYPRRSIDAVLRAANLSPEDIDIVAFAGTSGFLFQSLYKCTATFTIRDWIDQCHRYWKPKLLEGGALSFFDDFDMFRHKAPDLENDPYFPFLARARVAPPSAWDAIGQEVRREAVREHLGIEATRVRFYRHEDCHKAYGFYSAPGTRERALVFTIEGGGDDSSATISTAAADGSLTEHWQSNAVMAGRLYRYVTLILGMLPSQHEYKVMGLAPYGTAYHGQRSLEFFRQIHDVVGTEIRHRGLVKDMYFSVRDALEGERFDGVAWGLQTWLEELLIAWVSANVSAHGIENVILSGGVAQNIKACKRLAELDGVRRFWVGPISGDGSLGIGAAWLAQRELAPMIEIEGLPTVYLGTQHEPESVAAAIEGQCLRQSFHVAGKPTPDEIASWLEQGYVIGRFSGRMEFGQRALGNRSILADPRRAESVERINSKIKYRDFWMPFTPSMTIEYAQRALQNPKDLFSPYMTMAFDLKPGFEGAVPAAMHPADKTVRTQMLRRSDNPSYYAIIDAFARRTGVGAVLNTSFNLHGDSIVESPLDAINTFKKSDIDILLFDDVAVGRIEMPRHQS